MKFKLLLISVLFIHLGYAQINVRDSVTSAWHFTIDVAAYAPGGDLADRYGAIFGAGLNVGKKTIKNWLWGVTGTFYFGANVKNLNDIYGQLSTQQGQFIGLNGEYANLDWQHRGLYFGGYFGKILPILNHNPSSGLFFTVGGGFLQNQIFARNPQGTFPQYNGEYAKGYDRLHSGFALKQSIGYLNSGNKRTINFMLSFEFMQGFTTNERGYNWDQRQPDTGSKLDLYFGLKGSWFLPVYDKNQQKFFYY